MSAQHASIGEIPTHPSLVTTLDEGLLEEPQPRMSVQGYCLTLGSRVVLNDVSFAAKPGEIVGILGPNGSGKTSLLRCITGLMQPNRGTLWLQGQPLGQRDRRFRAQLGVVFQDPSLDDRLTAIENLILGAQMFGISKTEAKKRAVDLLSFMDLKDRQNDVVKTFSGGMRRRLELARALIHQPAVLLLDEPTTGLDPYAFERTWQRLLALRRLQQLTVVLNTHRADEAARCDLLVVLDRGHVVACDKPSKLLARVEGDIIGIDGDEPEAIATIIETELGLVCRRVGDQIVLEADNAHALVPRIASTLASLHVRSIVVRQPNLADAFFKLTGRPLMSEEHVES